MLKAPFPYAGGKSRIASEVWLRLGDVPNYLEPFCGSAAMLLARPHPGKVETINDADSFVSNFYRAVKWAPDDVVEWCDQAVIESDLHARHRWLAHQAADLKEKLEADPLYYDVRIAGWWVWGISCWIGAGFAASKTPPRSMPILGNFGVGVHRGGIPHLGNTGMGMLRGGVPHLSDAGTGVHAEENRGDRLRLYFQQIADRLREVRVCCGDWSRIMGPSVIRCGNPCGIFFDPPYLGADERAAVYSTEDFTVANDVQKWAAEHGDDPVLRIALCGYEGHYEMPKGWTQLRWKATGGYGSQGDKKGRANASREVVWFSPHCLGRGLFDDAYEDDLELEAEE